MRRTFTLRWLFVVVTMVCVLAALAAAFPQEAFGFALTTALFVPAWIVVAISCAFSSNRVAIVAIGIPASVFGGATLFVLFSSLFEVVAFDANPPTTSWELYVEPLLPISVCATAAALVACVFAVSFFPRKAR
jgi:hypothetical protein